MTEVPFGKLLARLREWQHEGVSDLSFQHCAGQAAEAIEALCAHRKDDVRKGINALGEEPDGSGIPGFMDYIDYECELGFAAGGNAVYPSAQSARENRKCIESCGIVEVRVKAVRVVQEPSDFAGPAHSDPIGG